MNLKILNELRRLLFFDEPYLINNKKKLIVSHFGANDENTFFIFAFFFLEQIKILWHDNIRSFG